MACVVCDMFEKFMFKYASARYDGKAIDNEITGNDSGVVRDRRFLGYIRSLVDTVVAHETKE